MGARERCILPGAHWGAAPGGRAQRGVGPRPSDGNRIPTRGTLPAPPPGTGWGATKAPAPRLPGPGAPALRAKTQNTGRGARCPLQLGPTRGRFPPKRKAFSGLPGVLGKGRSALNGNGGSRRRGGGQHPAASCTESAEPRSLPAAGGRTKNEISAPAGQRSPPSTHPQSRRPQPHSATPREPRNPRPASTGAAL